MAFALLAATTLAATARRLQSTAAATCPCLTATTVGSYPTFTLAGETTTYPNDYGLSTCAAHDTGKKPYCMRSNPPSWCADQWCYVDKNNCDKPISNSVFFPGLTYSYFTCGASNTFDSWFGNPSGEVGSGDVGVAHQLTELVTLMQTYTTAISETLEENFLEAAQASGCSPASSCNCADCKTPTVEWEALAGKTTTVNGQTEPLKTPDMTLAGATYKTRPGTSTTSKDATTDQCLANIVTSSFTRIAAKESDPKRVGYEYYGSQSLGNYVQWPGMEDCKAYDPRYRPWYAAAASGPKDVVLVIDTSGSMDGALNAMAKQAATMVIDTLTEVDYVTIVKYSSRASAYSNTLVKATTATKADLKTWIDSNIDAAGTTNFRAAFEKAWEVVDATTTSSSCNRIMLFLSDGVPNDWNADDYASVRAKSASYSPPMHLLTYGLGSGADPTVLKNVACQNSGIYYSVTEATIKDTMASYFQVLAPMLSPCKLRWTLYNDYYTGQELLGACLASFELESANSKTSCNGGLSGLGEKGDTRVPKLIGVGCVDMNLVVDLPTLEAHPEYPDFKAKMEREMKACPMVELTEGQMETLRNEAGGTSAMCGAEEAKKAKDQVVLMFTASGSVSDYSDTSSLQQAIATAAGVDKSLVRIDIVAASVYITAYIDVPASTTATAVQELLSSKLGTAAAASAELGITVESDPIITIRVAGEGDEPFDISEVISPILTVIFVFTIIFVITKRLMRRRAEQKRQADLAPVPSSQPVSYPNAYQPQQQPQQQMQMGAVPMCQGAVVAQPSAYPQAVAQPYGGAVAQPYGGAAGYGQQPQAVAMGQVIS